MLLNKHLIALLSILTLCVSGFAQNSEATTTETENLPPIKGIVFDDLNGNGKLDAGEKGIEGVPVSDQNIIVKTNADGAYELPGSKHVTVYVNTPAQWMAPPDKVTGVPKFFINYHAEDQGTFKKTDPLPASVDFALTKRPDADSKKFKAIIMGDSQLPDSKFAAYNEDIVNEIVGVKADFVAILGDICSENINSFAKIAEVTYKAEKPVYGIIGNHDRNYDAKTFPQASANFKQVFGPDYYSFDIGDVHFVVLDSVYFNGKGGSYGAGFNKPQLKWLAQDISMVDKDKMVVLMMHIPLVNSRKSGGCSNRDEVFKLLEDRTVPTIALSGHWHSNCNYILGKEDGWNGKAPFYQCILPHACGCWWNGPPDERNVPLSDQTDGTPNGWTIWEFDGTSFKTSFMPSNKSATFQSRIYTPDMRTIQQGINGIAKDSILVNAFYTYENAKVEMRIDDGEWKPMEKIAMQDPYILSYYNTPYSPVGKWVSVVKSSHIWKGNTGKIEKGWHAVYVRFPKIDGDIIEQGRVFYQEY